MYSIGNHEMQHGGCEARRMNSKVNQQHSSPNNEWRNFIGQLLGSNSLVKKLLLLIYKGGIY